MTHGLTSPACPEPPGRPSVAVVGLGYVGSCLVATLAGRGLDTVGIDVDHHRVRELAEGKTPFHETGLAEALDRGVRSGRLRVTTDYAVAAHADVVLLCVGTPIHDDGALDDRQLRQACRMLSRHLRAGQLIVVKSTVPPGTTRNLIAPLLEAGGLSAGTDFHLAFSPERLAESTALSELKTFPVVVGGIDGPSSAAAADFWQRALALPVLVQQSLEAAELVKLADNWWIDLNIALSNELAKLCDPFGVDVLDVIEAANSIPKGNSYVNILRPSVGVGGSCLTKDPWMVWHTARAHGVDIRTAPVGRLVNDGMPEHTAQLIVDELVALGKNPADCTIAVLGVAFKNNTSDLRSSPARAVVEALTKTGAAVRVHDPLVDPAEAEELLHLTPCATVEGAVRDADCIAVLALHAELEDIDFAALPVADSCLLLDGRAYYPKEKLAHLRELGYHYRGIGR